MMKRATTEDAEAIRNYAAYAAKIMRFSHAKKIEFLQRLLVMVYEEGLNSEADPRPHSSAQCAECNTFVIERSTPTPTWFCPCCNTWKQQADLRAQDSNFLIDILADPDSLVSRPGPAPGTLDED